MMKRNALFSAILTASTVLPTALAQTWTACNPLNETTCPLDPALGVDNYTIDFVTQTPSNDIWNTTAGTIKYGDEGAEFTINKKGDSPTVQTNFYFFFGSAEVIMKTAHGIGVVSSIVLESDDLDEVDWEMLGGNTTHVETNYFGKGNTTSFDRAIYYPVDNPQGNWHNYTVTWTKDQLDWYVDSQHLRTLKSEDAEGGSQFPQTPMNLRLGIWAGGDPKNPNGTIEWAGGEIDYDGGPYTMTVKSVKVSDASRGTQYQYGDTSGSWSSIKVLKYAYTVLNVVALLTFRLVIPRKHFRWMAINPSRPHKMRIRSGILSHRLPRFPLEDPSLGLPYLLQSSLPSVVSNSDALGRRSEPSPTLNTKSELKNYWHTGRKCSEREHLT